MPLSIGDKVRLVGDWFSERGHRVGQTGVVYSTDFTTSGYPGGKCVLVKVDHFEGTPKETVFATCFLERIPKICECCKQEIK